MHALLLIAHGSRREASNEEVRDLVNRLVMVAGNEFDLIVPAFLELAVPGIPEGVGLCVDAGATVVTAVPYFLSAGRHVVADIPAELEKAQRRYPNTAIQQSDYLGQHDAIPEILLALASARKQAAADVALSA